MLDTLPEAFLDALADAVRDVRQQGERELERLSAEARATIAELQAKVIELSGVVRSLADEQVGRVSAAVGNVKDGAPGRDGRDAEPVDMAHIERTIEAKVDERVEAKVATIAVPKDGRDGVDGKDGDSVSPETVEKMLSEQVAAAFATITVPKDGIDGRDGVDGKDGVSVPVEIVEKMISDQVAAAFATLPVPKDGHSPTLDELLPIIEPVVQQMFANIPVPENGKDGADGQNGKDAAPVTSEQISAVIKSAPELFDEAAARYLTENPPAAGRDGVDGKDGAAGAAGKDAEPITKDAIVEAVLACGDALQEAVVKHLTDNPPPSGRDGNDGAPGDPGPAGKDASPITKDQIVEAIIACDDALHEAVSKHLTANPPPAGHDGVDGTPGDPGRDADPVDYESVQKFIADRVAEIPVPKNGVDGINGKDGVGLTGGLIDRSGSLVLTLSDGTVRDLGCVVGKDADQTLIAGLIRDEAAKIPPPRDGRDGIDGLGFDDMLAPEYDGKQTITFRFARGEHTKEYQLKLDIPYDAGMYREGETYPKSALTTFGGRSWIAQCDTSDKPDMANKDWRLWANKGRDGKDGVMRQIGPPGPVKLGS